MSDGVSLEKLSRSEFQDDWTEAPARSGVVPVERLRDRRILVVGDDKALTAAIGASFEYWNEAKSVHLQVSCCSEEEVELICRDGRSDDLADIDYVVMTGCCCAPIPEKVQDVLTSLERWRILLRELTKGRKGRRILLLSDGRVYGTLPEEFSVSEYESGVLDPVDISCKDAFYLQALEKLFLDVCRKGETGYSILRTGHLYAAGYMPKLLSPVYHLAFLTAESKQEVLKMSHHRSSYLALHDALTAIQYVLTVCPTGRILNAASPSSDVSESELVMMLSQNFPSQCRISLTWADPDKAVRSKETAGALLNLQRLEYYGFTGQISLEDGLIMLVKSLQKSHEIFIFDNTYKGKLTSVQQILLGYLLEIDQICRKNDIKYFLAGGTLLGAIRHQGFIPWDDDADVMMLREDFDRFMKIADRELPPNIFVQTYQTEPGNHNAFTKLRINDTLFATAFTSRFPDMHNGIFFDVLSHDRTGKHNWSRKLHLMWTMASRSIVFNKWGNQNIKSGGSHPVLCKIGDYVKYLVPMRFAEWMRERAYRFFKNRKTGWLYDGMGRNLSRGPFPEEWLKEAVYVPFEGCMLPVPKEYDKYLTWLYGDYMKMIPVSSRRTSHSIMLMDLGSYGAYRAPKQKTEDDHSK